MLIALLGATGTLGRSVHAELTRRGHTVRAASRSLRPPADGMSTWVRVDLTTGAGLQAAVRGADAVVDVSNSRSRRRADLAAVFVEGTGRVLRACRDAGGVRYVGISVVGIDRLRFGSYYQAKLRQEAAVAGGGAPWSLVRATQFHPLVDQFFTAAARLPLLPLPARVLLQPVDVADVASRLADAAEQPAAGRLADIGGPEVHTLAELGRLWMCARGRRRVLLRLPAPGRVGRALTAGVLCSPAHAVDGRGFAQWLATSGARAG